MGILKLFFWIASAFGLAVVLTSVEVSGRTLVDRLRTESGAADGAGDGETGVEWPDLALPDRVRELVAGTWLDPAPDEEKIAHAPPSPEQRDALETLIKQRSSAE